ncbi:MAG: pyrroline-5-carboxylate reductase [Rhodocyclaceae bacterium]|nr:pyrroline-5-carboxylate reductase [Rhodocyclaceae bacterium]
MKISFIGGGNMATALIGGLLERGTPASGLQVVEIGAEARDRLVQKFGVRAVAAPDAQLLDCDLLLLAVKPQQMREALAGFAGQLTRQVVVSIAAGLRSADLARWLGGYRRIVRAMPNTPALIGAGMTGLYADPSLSAAERSAAESVLAAVGATLWISDESMMDAVTAISGSGPAYVFHFIEALEAAARAQGFNAASARLLALQTCLGAARLAAQSEDDPATLRAKVTSKGGTTEAALASFASDNLLAMVGRAVDAACARGRELGDTLGRDA